MEPDLTPKKYLRGQLLLDSGQLHGSFFQRTVVLVCQHDGEGAFGLVLNRATGNNVGEMVVADLPRSPTGKVLKRVLAEQVNAGA